jgi:hypothetical protein
MSKAAAAELPLVGGGSSGRVVTQGKELEVEEEAFCLGPWSSSSQRQAHQQALLMKQKQRAHFQEMQAV